jgi:protein arginine kinase
VFSSRIRLARNFSDYPFSSRINNLLKEELLEKVRQVYSRTESLRQYAFVKIEDLSEIDRQFLLERHLISQEHSVNVKGKGLIVSGDERIALMINEEDHLRMQVIASGFNLSGCWDKLNEIDDNLSNKFSFAFLPDLGYLTSCPTNVGTGLRASCMLHLPALVFTKRINKILDLLAKIFFTTRGFFGEGTQALCDFFQISNQVTLGVSETEMINNLTGVVNQVKEQENQARQVLMKKYRANLEDTVCRALAILRSARLMSSKEAFTHLSMLSLGVDLGIIKGITRAMVNNLFISIQPAHLQKINKKTLLDSQRDYMRAQILREKLAGEI